MLKDKFISVNTVRMYTLRHKSFADVLHDLLTETPLEC